MKTTTAILIALFAFAITACGEDSPAAGYYVDYDRVDVPPHADNCDCDDHRIDDNNGSRGGNDDYVPLPAQPPCYDIGVQVVSDPWVHVAYGFTDGGRLTESLVRDGAHIFATTVCDFEFVVEAWNPTRDIQTVSITALDGYYPLVVHPTDYGMCSHASQVADFMFDLYPGERVGFLMVTDRHLPWFEFPWWFEYNSYGVLYYEAGANGDHACYGHN